MQTKFAEQRTARKIEKSSKDRSSVAFNRREAGALIKAYHKLFHVHLRRVSILKFQLAALPPKVVVPSAFRHDHPKGYLLWYIESDGNMQLDKTD